MEKYKSKSLNKNKYNINQWNYEKSQFHFLYNIMVISNNNYRGDQMREKDKVSLKYNLELERKDAKNTKKKGYDFVPRSNHWTSIDEQKIKVREIEEKTKE